MVTLQKQASRSMPIGFDWRADFAALQDTASAGTVVEVTDDQGTTQTTSDLTVSNILVMPNGEIRCWLSGGTIGEIHYLRADIDGTTPVSVVGAYHAPSILRVEIIEP